MIDERKEKMKNEPKYEPPQDFLQVLMEAKYRDGNTLTITEITGILIGILLGGQHTSNVTGTWLMSHLLKEKEWLEKIMKEQDELFKKKDGKLYPNTLTFEEVQNIVTIQKTGILRHESGQIGITYNAYSVMHNHLVIFG